MTGTIEYHEHLLRDSCRFRNHPAGRQQRQRCFSEVSDRALRGLLKNRGRRESERCLADGLLDWDVDVVIFSPMLRVAVKTDEGKEDKRFE